MFITIPIKLVFPLNGGPTKMKLLKLRIDVYKYFI